MVLNPPLNAFVATVVQQVATTCGTLYNRLRWPSPPIR